MNENEENGGLLGKLGAVNFTHEITIGWQTAIGLIVTVLVIVALSAVIKKSIG